VCLDGKWASPVAEILHERGEILLTGMKIYPYKTLTSGLAAWLLDKQLKELPLPSYF
jgi:hypothetical protein